MKILKQILFVVVLVAGMSVGVSAQKGGGQRPPKQPRPIKPEPKPTPKESPKKPGYAFVIALPENTDIVE